MTRLAQALILAEAGVLTCSTCGKQYFVEDPATEDLIDCKRCAVAHPPKKRTN